MSADNGVYILVTTRHSKQEGTQWVACEPYKVYRVAMVQAIDNLDYYKEKEPHNLGAYMQDIWGTSPVYQDKDQAILAAHKIADSIDVLEYGVSIIDTNLKFYGDL